MKSEQEIIIDGVDVAGCEHHLSTGYCQLQMIFQGMVLKLPFGKHLECNLCDKDCYYKQLKRLEQENERLKEEFTSFMNGDYCAESCKKMNNAFQDAHKGILKENEELKNILKDIDKKLELALDVEQTDAEESFDLLYEIQDIISETIGNELLEE